MRSTFLKFLYLINSQHLSDGIRITFSILLPAYIITNYINIQTAFPFCLGTICVSLTDSPGTLRDKSKGMLLACASIFFIALLTGLVNKNILLMGLEVAVICFISSMLTAYGLRMSLIGTASILVMILLMNRQLSFDQCLIFSLLTLSGGLWYLLISFTFFLIRPYARAEKALAECMIGIADYLKIKSQLLSEDKDHKKILNQLSDQQIKVSELQEACREQIFRSRFITKNIKKEKSRRLVFGFFYLQDFFEHILSDPIGYDSYKIQFSHSKTSDKIKRSLEKINKDLLSLAYTLTSGITYKSPSADLNTSFNKEDNSLDNSNTDLVHYVVQLEKDYKTLAFELYTDSPYTKTVPNINFNKFIFSKDEAFSIELLKGNITSQSSIFRHAVRVTIIGIAAYTIGKLIPNGGHSYWILLTSIFILKPAFSLTKKRNKERIAGTLIGAVVGFTILFMVQSKVLLFIIMALLMISAYTVQRISYILLVIFITPYVFIIFNFIGMDVLHILEERVIDTAIGCILAFAASYLILPNWESDKITELMKDLLKANLQYLKKALEKIQGQISDKTEYKLSRKDVYVSTANIRSAFERMKSEPESKKVNIQIINDFITLNHKLSSNIATISSYYRYDNISTDDLCNLSISLSHLNESINYIESKDKDKEKKISLNNSNKRCRETSTNTIRRMNEITNEIKETIKSYNNEITDSKSIKK